MLEEVGDMMILTGKTIVSALRPPYPYGGEFMSQFLFALRLCWFPLTISTIAFGYGAPGLQAGNFLVLFGAIDRLGGFFVLATIREFAPFVTAIILAGVGGTAITADLGARKIREELDALQVLGVDPIKNLVVPRFLALMLVTGALQGQGLRDRISELFIFTPGDQPLFLGGAGVHANHFITSASTQNGILISFISNAISGNVANIPVSATSGGATFRFEGGAPVRTSVSPGPVFAERHATVLSEDSKAARLIAYLHNNPVRAGVVPEAAVVVIWWRSRCWARCSWVSANSSVLTTAIASWSARICSVRRLSSSKAKSWLLCTSRTPTIRSPTLRGMAASERVYGRRGLG